ncbi:hypothetical protein LTR95_004342 [Oleoguttula sp. CCFEE 5521]
MDTRNGAQMRITRSTANKVNHTYNLHLHPSESSGALMQWPRPSAVAVAVSEDDYLDTARLEALWGFDFTPANNTDHTTSVVEPWSDMASDDSHMPAMALFDVCGLATPEAATLAAPGAANSRAPGAPVTDSHLSNRFACPLGLHGAHRMCTFACKSVATLDIPAMYCPVEDPVVKPGRYAPKHVAVPRPLDSGLWQLRADYAALRREYTLIRMAQSLATQDGLFFRLPAELRNEVYDLVIHAALTNDAAIVGVTEPRHLRIPHAGATPPAETTDTQTRHDCRPVPALLLTCKLIRKEAIELYTAAVDKELQKSVADIAIFWTDLGAVSKEARAKRWSVQAREAANGWNSSQAAAIGSWCKELRVLKKSGAKALETANYEW